MQRIVISVLMTLCLACSGAIGAAKSLDDILDHLTKSNDMHSERMQFQQAIQIRLLLFSWQFTADVTKQGDTLIVDVSDQAPSFVPDDMSSALIDIQSAVDAFDLTLVGEETTDNRRYYVIEGHRRESGPSGAQSGRLWIDAEEWYIAKANLAYTWGRIEVEQQYRLEQGRRVLDSQQAVARPLGARIQVDYGPYWFEDSESDIV